MGLAFLVRNVTVLERLQFLDDGVLFVAPAPEFRIGDFSLQFPDSGPDAFDVKDTSATFRSYPELD